MENLIPVNYDSEQPTVSARDLHEGLGINTDFRKWFPRMTEYGFTENVDWKSIELENNLNIGLFLRNIT